MDQKLDNHLEWPYKKYLTAGSYAFSNKYNLHVTKYL